MASAAVSTYRRARQESRHIAKRSNLLPMLIDRQQDRCFWCGELMVRSTFYDHAGNQIPDPHKATLDHLVAFAAEGATDDKNCVAACEACNKMRAQYNTSAWRREMNKKDTQLRTARNLTQWMTEQLLEERERRVAAEDAAAMHLATLEMETHPESRWQKMCRWFRG